MDQTLKSFVAAFSKSQDVFDTADAHLVMAIQLNKSRENVLQSHNTFSDEELRSDLIKFDSIIGSLTSEWRAEVSESRESFRIYEDELIRKVGMLRELTDEQWIYMIYQSRFFLITILGYYRSSFQK